MLTLKLGEGGGGCPYREIFVHNIFDTEVSQDFLFLCLQLLVRVSDYKLYNYL